MVAEGEKLVSRASDFGLKLARQVAFRRRAENGGELIFQHALLLAMVAEAKSAMSAARSNALPNHSLNRSGRSSEPCSSAKAVSRARCAKQVDVLRHAFAARNNDPRSRPPADGRPSSLRQAGHDAPISEGLISDVTITDPGHALFGRSFPLVSLRAERGRDYLVFGLPDGRRRTVRKSSTNLGVIAGEALTGEGVRLPGFQCELWSHWRDI